MQQLPGRGVTDLTLVLAAAAAVAVAVAGLAVAAGEAAVAVAEALAGYAPAPRLSSTRVNDIASCEVQERCQSRGASIVGSALSASMLAQRRATA